MSKGGRYVIIIVDMEDPIQEDAKQFIIDSFDKFMEEKDIANDIRKKMDKLHGESWNVIVGKAFGAHVVHQTNSYLFCSYDEISILLWKSG
mmetsp:Transcript_18729/g.21521  ORF Transcript_18729/g.21521 Transcript_18729/m.21521 type:complete len:91 (-) Transcript_18729:55-327(-)